MVTIAVLAIAVYGLGLFVRAGSRKAGPRQLITWMRQINGEINEIEQRRRLLSQPWLEDFAHWGLDGTLHGSRPPAPNCRRVSVTSSGWCPGVLHRATGIDDRDSHGS